MIGGLHKKTDEIPRFSSKFAVQKIFQISESLFAVDQCYYPWLYAAGLKGFLRTMSCIAGKTLSSKVDV